MRTKKFTKIICAVALAAALTLSGCSDLTSLSGDSDETNKPATETSEKSTAAVTQTSRTEAAPKTVNQPESNAKISDARNTPAVRVARTVGPAVVGITNKAIARDFFDRTFETEGVGSGTITLSRARRKLLYRCRTATRLTEH